MKAIIALCREVIADQDYITSWFSDGNLRFFGTEYFSPIYRERYFITRDKFMNSTIYAAKFISVDGIETIGGPCDTHEEAYQHIKEHTP